MSDLAKIQAENQKKILKFVAISTGKTREQQNPENSDSEVENTFIAPISTPISSKTTAQNNTQSVSRNRLKSNL